jgi:hypothetical protein
MAAVRFSIDGDTASARARSRIGRMTATGIWIDGAISDS